MTRYALSLFVLFLAACSGHSPSPATAPEDTALAGRVRTDTGIKKQPLPPSAPPAPYTTEANQIVPGERIGRIRIDMNGDSAVALLGKPDRSDAAMGKAWLVWTSRNEGNPAAETDLFTARRMGVGREESRVKEIRITSPFFHTADSIATGSTWEMIRKKLPRLHKISSTPFHQTRKSFYDDPSHGIAIELDGAGTCIAILVHEKNKGLADIYLPLQP